MPILPPSFDIETLCPRAVTVYKTIEELYAALCDTHGVLEQVRHRHERILDEYRDTLKQNLSLHSSIDILQKKIGEDSSLKAKYYASIRDIEHRNITLKNEVEFLKEKITESECVTQHLREAREAKDKAEAELTREQYEVSEAEIELRTVRSNVIELAKENLALRHKIDPSTLAGKRVYQLEASNNRELATVTLLKQQLDDIMREKDVMSKELEEEKARREVKIEDLEALVEDLMQNLREVVSPSPRPPRRRRRNTPQEGKLQARSHLHRRCRNSTLGRHQLELLKF